MDQAALTFHLTLGTPWYRNIRSVPKRAEQKISNFCLFVFFSQFLTASPFNHVNEGALHDHVTARLHSFKSVRVQASLMIEDMGV